MALEDGPKESVVATGSPGEADRAHDCEQVVVGRLRKQAHIGADAEHPDREAQIQQRRAARQHDLPVIWVGCRKRPG